MSISFACFKYDTDFDVFYLFFFLLLNSYFQIHTDLPPIMIP